MSKNKTIQISVPYMDDKEWQALHEPVQTGWLTQGPKVAAFEKAFSKRHGVDFAVATSNCTTALHLALISVGVGPGDGVVVPSFTWVATANVVEYCNAIPIFCDIDYATFNMDAESARQAILDADNRGIKIKAIIPVHLFGLCSKMDAISNLAQEYHLQVVEDAACAAGASYRGRWAGSMGDVGCFSFHPRKVLVTGEGGMCTTQDSRKAELINNLRNHGASLSEEQRHRSDAPYLMPDFNILGFNYRMTDLQGALGLVQLERLNSFITERQKWASWYIEQLGNLAWLKTPTVPSGCNPSWQAFVCTVDEGVAPLSRNKLLEHLYENGISSRVGTQAVHMLGYYQQKYSLSAYNFPKSRDAYLYSLALPLHNNMTEGDYVKVVECLRGL